MGEGGVVEFPKDARFVSHLHGQVMMGSYPEIIFGFVTDRAGLPPDILGKPFGFFQTPRRLVEDLVAPVKSFFFDEHSDRCCADKNNYGQQNNSKTHNP